MAKKYVYECDCQSLSQRKIKFGKLCNYFNKACKKCNAVKYELVPVARVDKNGEFKAIKKAKKHYSNIQIHNIMKAYVAQRKKKKKIKTGSCDYRDCLHEMSNQDACAYCENGSHWASKRKEPK